MQFHDLKLPLWALWCMISCTMAACGDDPLSRLEPKIEVVPTALNFGDGCVGVDNEEMVTVRNIGEGVLEISELLVDGDPTFRVGDADRRIGAQQTGALAVLFRPLNPNQRSEGELTIVSNDPQQPRLAVPLTGRGGFRRVRIGPRAVDFGVVNEGAPETRAVEIANDGGSPLEVTGLTWTSTSVDMGPQNWPAVPFVLAAKTATTVRVVYDPVDLGPDRGEIVVETDDTDEPVARVSVSGVANLAPRAVAWACPAAMDRVSCPVSERARDLSAGLGRVFRLDGLSAFDPEGGPLTSFEWTLVRRPDTSRAAVFFANDDRARRRATGELQVDRLGQYVLRLTVRDERGLSSAPGPESTVVIRPKDLDIRLSWDIATDVDLHFVRPGGELRDYGTGRIGTSTGSDCSTFNRGPDWGILGDPRDDPRLDKDDVSGRGPEVVSMDEPEIGRPYTVYAHYCDSSDIGVAVQVSTEIRIRGELAEAIPAQGGVLLNPGEVRPVAQIEWFENNAIIRSIAGPVSRRPDLCRD